jgi:flagellar protein FliT
VDAAKYVWWDEMREYIPILTDLLQITEKMSEQAKAIHSNMNQNETEQLEDLQILVGKREIVIKQLDGCIQEKNFHWTVEDQHKLRRIYTLEQTLQPLMNDLYQSFLKQMNRLNQRKEVSKKFIGAYQNVNTDGSFIDKRK